MPVKTSFKIFHLIETATQLLKILFKLCKFLIYTFLNSKILLTKQQAMVYH